MRLALFRALSHISQRMRLVSSVLARNEAGLDRYFRKVLSRCLEFSDAVVVLDDRSEDDTADVAAELGCIVKTRSILDSRAWGAEGKARQELWELALTHATGYDDWILVVDADHEMVGDYRSLCLSRDVNAWSFVLFDCWSETQYRSDEYWHAHTAPRPWLYAPHRVPAGWQPEWSSRGVHPGHAPSNFPYVLGIAPTDTHHILHWGWANPVHRQVKYQQYLREAHQLSPFERAHVESILH